jgi:hypothetical protein
VQKVKENYLQRVKTAQEYIENINLNYSDLVFTSIIYKAYLYYFYNIKKPELLLINIDKRYILAEYLKEISIRNIVWIDQTNTQIK